MLAIVVISLDYSMITCSHFVLTNITRNQRICTNCSMNIIECEYHVLLVCPKYRDLRIKLFPPYYCHWPTYNKFESLLCQNSKLVKEKIAKYIYHAHKLRNLTN